MKRLTKITALSLVASSMVMASGWRIPEQSTKALSLAGAYVANASGADSSYFNPAKMSYNDDSYEFEADLIYIGLSSIEYKDATVPQKDGSTKKENFLIPTMFLSSKEYSGFRWGLNVVAPGGLSKRWDDAYQKAYAKEFTLEIIEFNPVFSYKVTPEFSVGGGLRVIYSHGVVENEAPTAKRELEGETVEYGYNLALNYKPLKEMDIALTYRSNVDLKEEGNAKLYLSGSKLYDGGANVTVPLPAVLAFACSYEFSTKTTVELNYERTFWSEYKTLDFGYSSAIPAALVPAFDDPKSRAWNDSDAIRIGLTQEFQNFDLMAGFAYDANPVDDNKVSFELPDSDAYIFSFGGTYYIDSKQSVSAGYLCDMKKDRTVKNDEGGVDGEFSNAFAHLASIAYRIKF